MNNIYTKYKYENSIDTKYCIPLLYVIYWEMLLISSLRIYEFWTK